MYGAVNLLNTYMIGKVAAECDDDLYIIPSSIHEIMLVPAALHEASALKNMLKNGNEIAIEKEEFLSNNIYYFDRESRKVEIAQ
jgi:hypothetical protein